MAVFYTCKECNNVLLAMGGSPDACKGEGLVRLEPNAQGAETDTHKPKLSTRDGKVHVGLATGDGHETEWLYIETTYGGMQMVLTGDETDGVQLDMKPEEVTDVYAWCTPCGLVKAEEMLVGKDFETNDVSCSPEFPQGCVNPSGI